MAKEIKVYYDDISQISGDLDKLLSELETTYTNIKKEKSLITERWKSAAAIKYINQIEKQSNDLKKAIKKIKETKKYVLNTSKKVCEADDQIKKKFSSIIN